RSKSSVPSPASRSVPATMRLRGLKRLLPLPCANTTRPRARSGTSSDPYRVASPARIAMSSVLDLTIRSAHRETLVQRFEPLDDARVLELRHRQHRGAEESLSTDVDGFRGDALAACVPARVEIGRAPWRAMAR